MKLRWTRRGIRTLLDVTSHIRAEQPSAAEWIGTEIEKTAVTLANFPEAGLQVPGRDARYFTVPQTKYLLIYRVHTNWVSILMVVHGAMDWR